MYCYIVAPPSIVPIENLQSLQQQLKKARIEGEYIQIEGAGNSQNLTIPDNCNTIVAIGDDSFYEQVISSFSAANPDLAFGYLPSQSSLIAQEFGIPNISVAIEALKNRKIFDYHPMMIRHQQILYSIDLIVNSSMPQQINLVLDGKLHLEASLTHLTINHRPSHAFTDLNQFELVGYSKPEQTSTQASKPVFNLPHPLSTPPEEYVKLRLSAHTIDIKKAPQQLADSTGRQFKVPTRISINPQPIRLVTRKEATPKL